MGVTPRTPVLAALLLPMGVFVLAFFVFPMVVLTRVASGGPQGLEAYLAIVVNPGYRAALMATLGLSAGVTAVTLVLAGVSAVFLARTQFTGRSLLVSMLTLPLAFPGVVVGFMIILLAGRQGLIGLASEALTGESWVFAYSFAGLFLGYVYFSVPRTLLTLKATAEKLDPRLEEAARSLGASHWQVARDVMIPGLSPALVAAGAICFATAMGAFGTAFTLATRINVLPMVIYTEFTDASNIALAAAMSLMLGAITWCVLALSRQWAGSGVAAAG